MNDCDVLINVGNESPNQTPSKVFDYISTMKCIINFYSINDDTSKWYLSNYPYVLNIKNGGNVEDDTKKFIEFAKMSKKQL